MIVQKEHQDVVIKAFVKHLVNKKGVPLSIVAWPDEVNGSIKEIDAIARGNGFKIAIEHTSIDTFQYQRRDDARFTKVFGKIKSQLIGKFSDRVRLTVPFYAIPTGTNWSDFTDSIKKWILENVPALPYGCGKYNVPKIPFEIQIEKRRSSKPAFLVVRFAPEDNTLVDRLYETINENSQKLVTYKKRDYQTILLIENSDISSMNLGLMEKSVKEALIENLPKGLDEIWYANTEILADLEFYLIWPNSDTTGINKT